MAGSKYCRLPTWPAMRIISWILIATSEITHLRLQYFSGRRYREAASLWRGATGLFADQGRVDLLALEHGGRALSCSDEHYGSMHNLNVAGRGVNMGDGWETARRRGPGNDWVVLALGHAGVIESVEVDTAHFKGNYPDRVSLDAALFADGEAAEQR